MQTHHYIQAWIKSIYIGARRIGFRSEFIFFVGFNLRPVLKITVFADNLNSDVYVPISVSV